MVEGIQAGIYKYNPSNHSLILVKNEIYEDIYNVSLMRDSIKNAAAVIIYCAVFEERFPVTKTGRPNMFISNRTLRSKRIPSGGSAGFRNGGNRGF